MRRHHLPRGTFRLASKNFKAASPIVAWILPRSTVTWLWLAYLVIPGTVAIFLLFLYLLRRLPATVVAYQFVLAPIVSITLGGLLLGESIGPGTVVGAAVVAGAVYVGALSPAAGGPS